jgi:hypothetical protein
MNKLLLLGLLSLSLVLSPALNVAQSTKQNQFVGAWHLISLEQPDADGKLHRVDRTGLFVFTPDGHASVQVMDPNPKPQFSNVDQYSQGGYEATFGTYTIDERTHTFSIHVDGSLVRSLVGKNLMRTYELTGNQLIIKSTSADEHWRATWQRY